MSQTDTLPPSGPKQLWLKWRFHLNILLILIPLGFMPKYFADASLFRGDSGLGAYHGETGFLRFTHEKSVFVQSRWAMGQLLYPPYGERFARVMSMIRRLL